MIKGYPSSIPQSVTWTYTVNDCMLPPQGDTLSFADIGTRVAFVTPVSQSLDEKQSSGYSHARLIVLDGQQGTLVSEFNVSIPNPGQAPGSVATQYSGMCNPRWKAATTVSSALSFACRVCSCSCPLYPVLTWWELYGVWLCRGSRGVCVWPEVLRHQHHDTHGNHQWRRAH